MSNKNKSNKQAQKPGSVEDAAKALKEHQQGGEDQGGSPVAEDLGGEEKPGEETKGAGEESPVTETEETKGEDQGGSPSEETGVPNMVELTEEEFEEAPVPDEAYQKKFAEMLAKSPANLEAFRNTIAMADAIILERNKGTRKTVAELETENYNRLVATYGKDFVVAEKGTNKGMFSRKAWNAMSNKRGWKEVTKVMPEVAQ